METAEIRKKFLEFFEKRGHAIVPSSSLIPDDPSVLLTTAGMQQFKPYLTGLADPVKDFGSKNVFSIQKSFRTTDIDEVGDESHLTFFEMVGNFSFGGYFKERAIALSFELLTSKKEGFGLDPQRIFATAFKGDEEVPRDNEAISLWQEQFKTVGIDAKLGERIFLYGREKNWWEAGLGPAGPDAEIFYDLGKPHNTKFGGKCHPNCDCGRFVEIGNDVFVQYNKTADGKYKPLKQKSIDNGRGFERLVMILQGKKNVFEIDLLHPLVLKIKELAPQFDERGVRVLADHARAVTFLIADGLRPSNKEAGYILRRLIRRILAYQIKYDIHANIFPALLEIVSEKYSPHYPELKDKDKIFKVFEDERLNFEDKIPRAIKEMERRLKIHRSKSSDEGRRFISEKQIEHDIFDLYQTFGIPLDIIEDLLVRFGYRVDKDIFKRVIEKRVKEHQEISRAGQEKKFGGHGLILNTGELKAGSDEELKKVTQLHTATHLLNQALRDVLGKEVEQRGSDITTERTRFDFTFPRKMTPEEIKKVESIVNEKIAEDLPVGFQEMPKAEAEATGALHFFKGRYPDRVKVYYVGKSLKGAWSKEFCGGPHVSHTGEIGKFKIIKEEASSAGVRRLRATVD